MKHLLILITFLSFSLCKGISQNLLTPADAEMVFTIRGGEIFNKMSVQEMESMPYLGDFFKEIIKMTQANEASSVSELGIDLNQNSQYFVDIEEDNNVVMMGVSFYVNNSETFKKYYFRDSQIQSKDGVEFILKDGLVSALSGNRALLTYALEIPDYGNNYDSYYYEEEIYYEEDVAVEEAYEDEVIETIEEMPEDLEEEIEEEEIEETYYERLAREREEEHIKEKEKQQIVAQEYVLKLYSNPNLALNSLNLEDKLIDNKADFSMHITKYMETIEKYQEMTSSGYNYYSPFSFNELRESLGSFYDGIEFISANGYFEKEGLKMEVTSKFSDEFAEFNRKLAGEFNEDMLKYIPYDSEIGHVSIAMNTENSIDAYYDVLRLVGESFDEDEAQAFDLGVSMVELFIDEKAIGNLFKGDMYFGVTDLNSYEVEYTSYEYDENWNSTEVTKTKQEIRPDFLLMFSSSEYDFVEKVLKMISSQSNGEFKKVGDYYTIQNSNMVPLDIYCMHKDGIVFIFTSQSLFDSIMKGGTKAKSSKTSDLTDNVFTISLNAQTLFSKIPLEDLSEEEREMVLSARENLGEITIEQSNVKGNTQTTSMWMDAAGDYSNSLEYFVNLFNEYGRIQNQLKGNRN